MTAIALPTDRVIAAIEGAVGWITFNNPARRNAMSQDMWEAVPLALDRMEADPAVRVIVLRGMGDKAFVAGADISQFNELRSSPETVAKYDGISDEASRRLAKSPKPTIAMIRGYCIGGGVGIAVCCDMRIASEGAKFGVPATRLGLGYGPSGVKRLMDLVGPSHVKESSTPPATSPPTKPATWAWSTASCPRANSKPMSAHTATPSPKTRR